MATEGIRTLVESRIDEDKRLAADVARRLTTTGNLVTNDHIQDFFPELEQLPDRSRSNLPKGVSLPHQLLLGPPTILDIEPLSERDFEERHRITVRAAEELALYSAP